MRRDSGLMGPQSDNFAIQVSFLYTNGNSERVLRIINYTCVLESSLEGVYSGVDYQVIGNGKSLNNGYLRENGMNIEIFVDF